MSIKNLFLVLFLGIVPAAQAEPIAMTPELESFLLRKEEKGAVLSLMHQQWNIAAPNCKPKLDRTNVLIEKSPEFNASGAPVSGVWRVISHFSGCNKSYIFSVEYVFTPDGQMKRIALLPGTTVADQRLQRDALMYAYLGMKELVPGDCKDVQFLDTEFVEFEKEGGMPGRPPIKEKWTVRACGVTGKVTLHFIPDATGTTITAAAKETVRVEADQE